MSKILGLDLGDQWTGIALSDSAGIIARPYATVPTATLVSALRDLIEREAIVTIVLGLPQTMRATISQQTTKVLQEKERLAELFPMITWVLWDERLSSKRAEAGRKAPQNKEEKRKLHAIAAAYILDSYLIYLTTQKDSAAS